MKMFWAGLVILSIAWFSVGFMAGMTWAYDECFFSQQKQERAH